MEVILIADNSQVGEARRHAMALSKRLGFNETAVGQVGIVATELAANLIKHGLGGEFLLGGYQDETGSGFECLALDKGPGMANIDRCIEDGFSTSGTSGTGLGAVMRQSHVLDIFTQPNKGTAILARISLDPKGGDPVMARSGVVSLPYPKETVCGDGHRLTRSAGGFSMMIADGLGHGIFAAEASNAAIEAFDRLVDRTPMDIAQTMHVALRKTRGAAVGIARYERDLGTVTFIGVGNVASVILDDGVARRMVSHNGTIGHTAPKFQSFAYAATAPFLMIMASDGLGTTWTLDAYPGLWSRHPSLIAGVLYRDFRRSRDDVTILVVREERR
jgi:anti-sigma regulatory factor (Ser/Thr protein kinase)